jgi:hypothetical protein
LLCDSLEIGMSFERKCHQSKNAAAQWFLLSGSWPIKIIVSKIPSIHKGSLIRIIHPSTFYFKISYSCVKNKKLN